MKVLTKAVFFLFLFSLGGAIKVYATDPIGWFDQADCNQISGWACDLDEPAQAIDVHLYSDGQYLMGGRADVPRSQPVADKCGGENVHGFSFTPPNSLLDGQVHQIKAYGLNIGPGSNASLPPGELNLGPCFYDHGKYTSNLRDPGLTIKNWWDWKSKETCFYDNPEINLPSSIKPIWEFVRAGIDGTVCNSNVVSANWVRESDGYRVEMSIDNANNSQNCEPVRNYLGIQPHWAVGRMRLNSLKFSDLESIKVITEVKLNNMEVCDQEGCPKCENLAERDWADLFIALPMWDPTNEVNLWLELVLAHTKESNREPDKPDCLWDRCTEGVQCLKRMRVDADEFSQEMISQGEKKRYEIEIPVSVFQNLGWDQPTVDWNNVIWTGGYVGAEISGQSAKVDFEVSNLDFLYLPAGDRECISGTKKLCGEPGEIGWGEQICVDNQWQNCQIYDNYQLCQICSSGLAKNKGNADCNNFIDLIDFAAWLGIFKSEGTEEQKGAVDFDCEAESDSEHIVDLADFRLWLDNFLLSF